MSIYVTMSSDKALEYFPNNKAYKFTSHLNSPLFLDGLWRVALVEAEISCSLSKEESIYLYSNLCGESIVDGEQKPLLRRLTAINQGNWSSIFEAPHYVPVRIHEIYDMDVYITTSQDELASFLNNTSTVTLHFKSFPFF